MDLRTMQILKSINLHTLIRRYMIMTCYALIGGGMALYIFIAVSKNNQKFKLVVDYTKDANHYKTEKIMMNPRIKFQYNEDEVYNIIAQKASHKDEQEIILFDVYASGNLGNITSGELKIDEKGNHLVFTKNPVLILNK